MATMRAAVFDCYGGPEVLGERALVAPTPREGEVLVRVDAASVNGYDVAVRSGALKLSTGRSFPKSIGLDFAGEVASADAASPFRPGDRVWGVTALHRLGSAAELVSVAPAQLSLRPEQLDAIEAASLPVVGSTAITALRDIGRLRSGHRLLVRGASGGVGSVAVQLGRALGAHVTGLASAANLDRVRSLGAHEALDYRVTRPVDLAPFDVILDTVGSQAGAWRRRLGPHGRMIAIIPDLRRPLRSLAYFAWSRLYGERRIRFFSDKPDTGLLTQLADYVRAGAIMPVIDQVFALENIADAHRAFEAGGRCGKQVIRIA